MCRYVAFVFLLTPLFSFSKEFNISSSDELKKVMKLVKEGDVVIWKSGSYEDQHIEFHPTENGTKNNPIKLVAEYPGKVRFFGDSYLTIAGSYLHVEGFVFQGRCNLKDKQHVIRFSEQESTSTHAQYCRVTNCAVIDYTLTEESGATNSYVDLEGSHNELDHCYFKGKLNKGPAVIVSYAQPADYVEGSDQCPSTYHYIHHNYFGYRTFSSNGGEQLRVGVSATSGTRGFNVIESNFFEDTRKEAEVVSNKSCNNIYRYNVLLNNDGALVLRHGTDCLVYGNYINGKSGHGQSGGIRIVNPNQTVFNNLIDEIEGSNTLLKGPIVVMSGFKGAGVNEYTPADNSIVAFNIIRNSIGPAIKVGVCNTNKGRECDAPKGVRVEGNIVMHTKDDLNQVVHIDDNTSDVHAKNNYYVGTMNSSDASFKHVPESEAFTHLIDIKQVQFDFNDILSEINKRAETFSLKLTLEDLTQFNPDKIPSRKEVGVSWMHD